MAGFFKKVFSGPDAVASAMDGVKKGLDAVWFTNEERAQADDKVRDFMIRYLEATQPQNLARRYIAFGIVGLWMALVALAVASRPFSLDYSDFVFSTLRDVVAVPFAGIMAFYFGAHLIRSYRKPPKE